MKVPFNEITIAEPCTQNWEEMQKGSGFNFCAACSKNVIDFSGYTNAQIIQTLASASSSVCGRLSQAQLNQLNYHLTLVPATNRNWMKYLGVLAIGVSIFVQDAKAESFKTSVETFKTIQYKSDDKKPVIPEKIYGYVIGIDNKPAAGVKISIFDTQYSVLTDKNGRYEIVLDHKFDTTKNQLMVENAKYTGFLVLNFSKAKQNDLKLKKAESMIMGKIIMTSKK